MKNTRKDTLGQAVRCRLRAGRLRWHRRRRRRAGAGADAEPPVSANN